VSVSLRQAELGEAALVVRPEYEPRDLAPADMEQVRCPRPHLPELHTTRLAASNHAEEHEDTLVTKLPILLHSFSCDIAREVSPQQRITAPGVTARPRVTGF
jgi:hypothetical protein